MPSVSDTAMANLIAGGSEIPGSIADRELDYLQKKTVVGGSIADKTVALGRKPKVPLGTYP